MVIILSLLLALAMGACWLLWQRCETLRRNRDAYRDALRQVKARIEVLEGELTLAQSPKPPASDIEMWALGLP